MTSLRLLLKLHAAVAIVGIAVAIVGIAVAIVDALLPKLKFPLDPQSEWEHNIREGANLPSLQACPNIRSR